MRRNRINQYTKHGSRASVGDVKDLNNENNMSIEGISGGVITRSELPTLYQHYTSGGITCGLNADQKYFTLNEKNITLYSGAMHYFRIPAPYWRDRLKKARAAGLNAVETYIPWNLHEPEPGNFEWGDGKSGSDFASFLDVKKFLKIAQEEDLLAIVRPGPFICSEWEFGGLPSWLLREKDIKVRTSDEKFMKHVRRYFNALLSILATLQFTQGGPIIAFQIENEYGSTEDSNHYVDKEYLLSLKQLMIDNKITELLFTSDSPASHNDVGSIPGVLQTANFQSDPEKEFGRLQQLQPGRPLMAMEYWTGWFDHWSETHHTRSANAFEDVLKRILQYPASVNMYMFHGGTNWGFLNGANIADGSTDNKGYQPDTTSYDYDAPLSEAGDYTDKYIRTKNLINQLNSIKTKVPETPHLVPRVKYEDTEITEMLSLQQLENQVPSNIIIVSENLLPMELLPINNNSGQSYGYIVYRKTNLNIPSNSILQIKGRVCDTIMVLINGELKSKPLSNKNDLNGFGYWRQKDSFLNLGANEYTDATLELVVENWGRNNFGKLTQFVQFKGLWQGPVFLNNRQLNNWNIIPLEFRTKWTDGLANWSQFSYMARPGLYRTQLKINEEPRDSFIDMRQWTKGFVVINGFVLGRYAKIGPQRTLYLPGCFLKRGQNEILVFEHFTPFQKIQFVTDPIFT